MKYLNKKNGKIGTVIEEHPGSVIMEFEEGKTLAVSRGTLKRWYKEVDEQEPVQEEVVNDVADSEEDVADNNVVEEIKEKWQAIKAKNAENKSEKVDFADVIKKFKEYNKANDSGDIISAVIVFTEDSFDEKYTKEQRSYRITSDNLAFMPKSKSKSMYVSAIDGTDDDVRLDWYAWDIEECYFE